MVRPIQIPNGNFETGVFFPWRDIGRTTIGTTPNSGGFNAFLIARPFEFASITTRVNLGPPEPQGFYQLFFFVSRGTIASTGTLVISLSNSLAPPFIIPLEDITDIREGYSFFSLRIADSSLLSRNNDISFELNGGAITTSLLIDDVQMIAV
ncbi:hypothetical protein M1E11_26030 (plasmid) [Bacillus sp. JZ8]